MHNLHAEHLSLLPTHIKLFTFCFVTRCTLADGILSGFKIKEQIFELVYVKLGDDTDVVPLHILHKSHVSVHHKCVVLVSSFLYQALLYTSYISTSVGKRTFHVLSHLLHFVSTLDDVENTLQYSIPCYTFTLFCVICYWT